MRACCTLDIIILDCIGEVVVSQSQSTMTPGLGPGFRKQASHEHRPRPRPPRKGPGGAMPPFIPYTPGGIGVFPGSPCKIRVRKSQNIAIVYTLRPAMRTLWKRNSEHQEFAIMYGFESANTPPRHAGGYLRVYVMANSWRLFSETLHGSESRVTTHSRGRLLWQAHSAPGAPTAPERRSDEVSLNRGFPSCGKPSSDV